IWKNCLPDAENVPLRDGGHLRSGQPLTDPAVVNQIGQVYQGRVALLTDALTFSAAEIFAAGFQDHAIGPVIGIDATTGGGGANVWDFHDLLQRLGPSHGLALESLPSDASISLAVRRSSRVGFFEGRFVEDEGVHADMVYPVHSADEVIHDYPGLVPFACETLFQIPVFRVDVDRFEVHGDGSV